MLDKVKKFKWSYEMLYFDHRFDRILSPGLLKPASSSSSSSSSAYEIPPFLRKFLSNDRDLTLKSICFACWKMEKYSIYIFRYIEKGVPFRFILRHEYSTYLLMFGIETVSWSQCRPRQRRRCCCRCIRSFKMHGFSLRDSCRRRHWRGRWNSASD